MFISYLAVAWRLIPLVEDSGAWNVGRRALEYSADKEITLYAVSLILVRKYYGEEHARKN